MLHDLVFRRTRNSPDAEFATDGVRTITFEEAALKVDALARAMYASGLGPGSRTAVLSPNSIEFVLLYLAASQAGTALVPLNTRLAQADWTRILSDAQPDGLFCASELIRDLAPAMLAAQIRRSPIAMDDLAPEGWEAMSDWLGRGRRLPPTPGRRAGDVVYHMYTSGTTGDAKGAMLTQRAVAANIRQIRLAVGDAVPRRSLVVAPMFHAAVVPSVFLPLACGGSVYIRDRFDAAQVNDLLVEDGIDFAVLVPTMLRACVNELPPGRELGSPSLDTIYYGAAPISSATLLEAMASFRCGFVQSYGLTEATQAVTFLTAADHRKAAEAAPDELRSAGRPADGCELRVVDELGHQLAVGQAGEVVVRGPQLMSGYWRRPEATARALPDGWLRTGDLGRVADTGHLFLQDRVADRIVSGGENLYPSAIERVLASHPSVADVAAIGVPDDYWGEAVKAFVVPAPGVPPDALALLAHCESRMARYERPQSIEFRDQLPRSAAGKVLRRVLREPYWSDRDRQVAGA